MLIRFISAPFHIGGSNVLFDLTIIVNFGIKNSNGGRIFVLPTRV